MRVTVTVSEPWDFVCKESGNVFAADVRQGELAIGPLLIRFVEPVSSRGVNGRWFVATRTATEDFSLHALSEAQASGKDWADIPAAWRGESPVARAQLHVG